MQQGYKKSFMFLNNFGLTGLKSDSFFSLVTNLFEISKYLWPDICGDFNCILTRVSVAQCQLNVAASIKTYAMKYTRAILSYQLSRSW